MDPTIEPREPRPPSPPRTMSIPEAGRQYFGLKRDASYYAARNGGIPVVRIGPNRLLANVDEIERRLAGETVGRAS